MALTSTSRRKALLVGLVTLCAAGIILIADAFGFLPTLPRTLAACKEETLKQLVSLQYHGDEPVDSPANQEYDSKYIDLLKACMQARGYRVDSHEEAKYVLSLQKIFRAIYDHERTALDLEDFWHRRWFWQGQE